MRNPVDPAYVFADIMNSHGAGRVAEFVSKSCVNHNRPIDPGLNGAISVQHGEPR